MPKIVDHPKYKRELLEKSFECFAKYGYGAMTMRELASHLNVSTGTLYHYFAGKQVLFQALVEHLAELDFVQTQSLPPMSASFRTKLLAVFELIEKEEEYFLKQTMIYLDYLRQHGAQEVSKDVVFLQTIERYRMWLQEYLGVDRDVVTLIGAALNGLLLDRAFDQTSVSFQKQATLIANLIESSMRGS